MNLLCLLRLLLTLGGLSICSGLAHGQTVADLEKTLKSNQWQKRIVVIYALTDRQPEFTQQKQILADEAAGVDERDILVIDAPDDRLRPADKTYLQNELGLQPDRFGVVLIGKDGEVKLRQDKPIPAKSLFSTIDGMSMRRQEMQKKNH